MLNLQPKIRKLLNAINMREQNRGMVYVYGREGVYSERLKRVCQLRRITLMMPIDRYNEMFPEKARRKRDKEQYVREVVAKSFRDSELLLFLVEIFKKGKAGGIDGG